MTSWNFSPNCLYPEETEDTALQRSVCNVEPRGMCALFWHLLCSLFLLKSHSPGITKFSLAMAIVAYPEHYGTKKKFSKKKFITSWESRCFEVAPKNDVRRRARNSCRLSGVTFASQSLPYPLRHPSKQSRARRLRASPTPEYASTVVLVTKVIS